MTRVRLGERSTKVWKTRWSCRRRHGREERPTDKCPPPKNKRARLEASLKRDSASSSNTCFPKPDEPLEMCGICDEAGAEFGQHVWQMWLRNTESATFVQALSSKAAAAGARGVDDLQSVGGFGKHPQNMARELKRKAIRKSKLPPPYYAQIPCWNDMTNACDMHEIPFYLPHEMLYFFIRHGVLSLASLCSIV